jgi:phage shock protein PspC (stress-responsive transcriptional regulator)
MDTLRTLHELKKSRKDRKIAGICGGFGEHTALPAWLWRALFLVSLVLGGFGLIVYVILWICMPPADPPEPS